MKAVFFTEHGDIGRLQYGDFPEPSPPRGWVKVRVLACSLNHLDILARRGMPGIKIELPGITGGDCAGEIAELGEDVRNWKVGDRVLVYPVDFDEASGKVDMLGETSRGALAEYCIVRASQLVAVPADVPMEKAACLPVAYGTAYRMMFTRGQVKAGESVLILGASGGVGTAAVQFAKMAGAHVIAAAGTEEKCARLRKIGADETINYAQEDFAAYIRRKTGSLLRGGGCDVVVNFTGGDTWARSLRCVKRFGRLLTCGATAGYDPKTDIRYIWTSEMTIVGSTGWSIEDQATVLQLLATGKLDPVIDREMPLSEGIEACRLIEDRRFFGKIVVAPDSRRS